VANKLLVITSPCHDPNPVAICDQAKELGLELDCLAYRDIVFDFSKDGVKFYSPKVKNNLEDYDYYIYRGAVTLGTMFWVHRGMLVSYFMSLGRRVLNGNHFDKYRGGIDKLGQTYELAKNNLPIPETRVVGSLELLDEQRFEYPFVLKQAVGSHGRAVWVADDDRKRNMLYTNQVPQDLLMQPYLHGKKDYRVLVVGKEVLGVMERRAKDHTFLTNFSMGGSVHAVELTDEMRSLALRVAEVFELEYVGVDLMPNDEGDLVVLEINSGAEFQGFMEVIDVNVPKKIVEYLISG